MDSWQDWRKADDDLLRDLATADPTALRARIRRAADLREATSAKEIAYFQVIIRHARADEAGLAQTANTAIPVDSRRQNIRDDRARVQAELDDIEANLRALPAGDKTFRPLYEEQRANRKRQLENLAGQSRILDEIAKGQTDSVDLLRDMTSEQEELLKGWENDISQAELTRVKYKDYYAAMGRDLDNRVAANSKNRRKRNVSTKSTAPPASIDPARMAGTWMVRQASGSNIPSATLEIRLEGNTLHGTYTAQSPGPAGGSGVHWTVEGKVSSHGPLKLQWTSLDRSASGDMDLTLAPDGVLSVDHRVKSGKTPVPDGVESFVRRP